MQEQGAGDLLIQFSNQICLLMFVFFLLPPPVLGSDIAVFFKSENKHMGVFLGLGFGKKNEKEKPSSAHL